jgi:pyruvate,water dikinase
MTWAIIKKFMSGKGGFGQMYRDLGFDPDPALDDIGIFDLICGRPYCNLSREPRMQYRNLPFEHNFEFLKKNPAKAMYPQANFNPRRAGPWFFITAPLFFIKMWWSQIRQQQMIRTFAEDFTGVIVPRYLAEVEKAEREDWGKLSNTDVLARMDAMIQLTLFDFARHSLKPTALAALMLSNLERSFAARLKPRDMKPADALAIGQERAQAALRELMMGAHPDEHTDVAAGVRAFQTGRLSKDEFLRRFGHRGSQEMELAQPRWAEDHRALDAMITPQPGPPPQGGRENFSPLPAGGEGSELRGDEAWQNAWRKLADDARLLPGQLPAVEAELRRLQTYVGLRETAKHHLMRGYAQIRRALLELDRRFQLGGDIFFLDPTWLAMLVNGHEGYGGSDARSWIDGNRKTREIALSLPVPSVLFSDDLDAIGRDIAISGAGVLQGTPLSAGVVEGSAWVLHDLAGAQMPHEPYILVCPSTDPAWVPLFVQARGLVMETGGMLSHGAIVAREFGLPAVAGIPDVHRCIKSGQRLRIDGGTGTVQIVQ